MISGFCLTVNEVITLLGWYAVWTGSYWSFFGCLDQWWRDRSAVL